MSAHKPSRTPEALFGQEISVLRRKLGISQEELAFRADVHRTYVSQIERGIKSPTLAVILRLSKALECSAGKLISAVESRS